MAKVTKKKAAKKAAPKKFIKLGFKPKDVTKKLVGVLTERAQDVLIKRYGLGKTTKKMTLEAIGQQYGITRERVRQIENYALGSIRKSDAFTDVHKAFAELEEHIVTMGGVIAEDHFLSAIADDASLKNHIHFLLVLGNPFVREKENSDFHHRWFVDAEHADQVEHAIKDLYRELSDDDLLSETELLDRFFDHLKDVAAHYRNKEIARRWIGMSKCIDCNPLGAWGRADSPSVRTKGIKDYAYLVVHQHGSPLHFREVAKRISELFDKKAHTATTHNELIKDPRFVLVGRGLYALTDWGYFKGVVRDVIGLVLEENGPLTKDEVIEKVLKERYVKDNTITVNLQNPSYFKKRSDGRYELA